MKWFFKLSRTKYLKWCQLKRCFKFSLHTNGSVMHQLQPMSTNVTFIKICWKDKCEKLYRGKKHKNSPSEKKLNWYLIRIYDIQKKVVGWTPLIIIFSLSENLWNQSRFINKENIKPVICNHGISAHAFFLNVINICQLYCVDLLWRCYGCLTCTSLQRTKTSKTL